MKNFFCVLIFFISMNAPAQKIVFDKVFPIAKQELFFKLISEINELIEMQTKNNFIEFDYLFFHFLIKINSLIDLIIKSQRNMIINDLIYLSKLILNIKNRYFKLVNVESENRIINNNLLNKIHNKIDLFTIHNLFLCQNRLQ